MSRRFKKRYDNALPDERQNLLMRYKTAYFKNKYLNVKLEEIYAREVKMAVPSFDEFKNLIENAKFSIENVCFQKKKNKFCHSVFFVKPENSYAQIDFKYGNVIYVKVYINENSKFSLICKAWEYRKFYSIVENLNEIANSWEAWKEESIAQAEEKELNPLLKDVKIKDIKKSVLKTFMDTHINTDEMPWLKFKYDIDFSGNCVFKFKSRVKKEDITLKFPFSDITSRLQEIKDFYNNASISHQKEDLKC
jgi:hypothetical protein